jgi:hypothetical protein
MAVMGYAMSNLRNVQEMATGQGLSDTGRHAFRAPIWTSSRRA